MKTDIKKKRKTVTQKKELAFYICIVALPFINFLFFQLFQQYIYMFTFSTQEYDIDSGSFVTASNIFQNYKTFWDELTGSSDMLLALKNSLIVYLVGWVITTPLGFLMGYFLYKAYTGYRLQKFLLMMPSMISTMVWVVAFKYFVEKGMVKLFDMEIGPLGDINKIFPTLLFYTVWIAVGKSFLMLVGVFNGVSPDLIDAGKVDGLRPIGELWHICLPSYYPLWSVGVLANFIGIFTATVGGFEFFGYRAPRTANTVGYLMFNKVMADQDKNSQAVNAAGSVIFTVIVIPFVLLLKWALEYYGPSEEPRKPIFSSFRRKKS